ncbi:MAG: phage portal protein [Rhodobiaceae bacterium]|nr:phage portal protein [Rhodobiaceae bacterium]MCC0012910.1 phage portal protein [Rhodobiaceae bacterium]MCC0018969.1 phage portal protein [Rhodobiaceae bacterium]MCC0051090.1 phage portal protein [Rhodobiaceae bacterium]MCC0060063.1 phage portal protein [Rhodobiaceae bacterium]
MTGLLERLARLAAPGRAGLASPPDAKASRTAALFAFHGPGEPVWTARDFRSLSHEGYEKNPVVHRCVRLVAEAVSSVPWLVFEGDAELAEHPLLKLLARPNAGMDGQRFIEAVTGYMLVAGNAYVEAVTLNDELRELHVLRPDRMKVVTGGDGWPSAYEYTVGAQSVRFDQDVSPAPILHLSTFHPTDDHYGMSPLEAARAALDIHNRASAWTMALLENAARPSGALVYTAESGLSREQYERLKSELETSFQGAANAGRPLLLEGGLDWRAMAMTPKDMDFAEARNAAARDIALCFGVPPMLLGIPGDNTYANYAEANRAFWRHTVLPMLTRLSGAFSGWLGPAFGDVRLAHDLDAIHALSADRDALWKRVSDAAFLTDDEKRIAVGYGTRE